MDREGEGHGNSTAATAAENRIIGLPVWAFIFLLAVGVRALLLSVWVSGHPHFYRIGGEIGRVALSLVNTGEFADPYMIPTGPTAHPAPLSPALLALIYHSLGVTAAAGFVRAAVGILSYSALYALMPWCAHQLGLGARAGIVAGILCALVPMHGADEAAGLGAVAHGSLAFAALVLCFLRRWTEWRGSAARSILLGIGCGAAFHVLPPLLLVVCGYLIFELTWKRSRRQCLLSACVLAGSALACVPWTWRNYTALHGLFFIRSNFGLELRIANHPGADADIDVTLARQGTIRHPSENLAEARRVRDLGEAEFNRQARREALEWIRLHPAEFSRLALMRFLHFWCGPLRDPWLAALYALQSVLALLGLRRIWPLISAPKRAAILAPLAAFPLVYYVVSYVAHYPGPLAWLLLLLAGHEVQSWTGEDRGSRA